VSEQTAEESWRKPLWMRWWEFKAWFHRCPECGHRPDRHYDSTGPRWDDDKTAAMLGIAQYGCRRCGHGSIAERDADAPEVSP
jgi:hypothetical protein